ncbi:MAG: endopeptidase La, partial [Nannocystaceae bacterium]
ASQRDPETENPTLSDLHPIGVLAKVRRIETAGETVAHVVLEGLARCTFVEPIQSDPYPVVRVTPIPDAERDDAETETLADALRERVSELAQDSAGPLEPVRIQGAKPGQLADRLAAALPLSREDELEVLMTLPRLTRLRLVAKLLNKAIDLGQMRAKADLEVRKRLSKQQHDAILRERIRAMKHQLGDGEGNSQIDSIRARIGQADLDPEAQEAAERELSRLETLSPGHPEFAVAHTYLEWLADLPWKRRAETKHDLEKLGEHLERDHYGLDAVKQRILEHLAVLELSGSQRGTILCLAGPPGVGKTSIARAIAEASGRPYIRIALGGVHDEAEIRGHRRTYVGALPGRIISAIRKGGVKNPVVLLDEVDKLGHAWGRSPQSALLELLDPEQNHTFTDHYLAVPFDLSEVMFICTANDLGAMSAPLRDRLEVVEIGGYTPDEKLHIAKRHLLPTKLTDHALPEGCLSFSDEAMRTIITGYTREAGVRQLGRSLAKVCRAVAVDVARNVDHRIAPVAVTADNLHDYLGRQRFFDEVAERTAVPGIATGLAWTPVGGDVLFVETSRMPGKGKLECTGQLGDVMKESIRAALTFVRSNADALDVDPDFLTRNDIHVHIPAGAVPKDGPSAGVTIFSALTSLLTGRRVRPDTAMTGEATLRGRVLPVGGISSKVLAAHRAGISRVILPLRNEHDLEKVPAEVRNEMEFIFVEDMKQVLSAALESKPHDPAHAPTWNAGLRPPHGSPSVSTG